MNPFATKLMSRVGVRLFGRAPPRRHGSASPSLVRARRSDLDAPGDQRAAGCVVQISLHLRVPIVGWWPFQFADMDDTCNLAGPSSSSDPRPKLAVRRIKHLVDVLFTECSHKTPACSAGTAVNPNPSKFVCSVERVQRRKQRRETFGGVLVKLRRRSSREARCNSEVIEATGRPQLHALR